METFKALQVIQTQERVDIKLTKLTLGNLHEGNVIVKVAYSSVNYKDSLAVQQNGGVIRDYPMIPGIDMCGIVAVSDDPAFQAGDPVLVTGYDFGVSHTGGYAEYARVKSEWLVPLPAGLSMRDAMVMGTAGLTAALSIQALETAGMSVVKQPNILVTGATGGVGSLALQILRKMGYQNIDALSRKKDSAHDLLKNFGARAILTPAEFIPSTPKPLGKQTYDYVIDTVGGTVASAIIPHISYKGAMTLCGQAAGIALNTNVLPFILRGIQLIGIDSVYAPMEMRRMIWNRFATDWYVSDQALVHEVSLEALPKVFTALQAGTHSGRTIVVINPNLK